METAVWVVHIIVALGIIGLVLLQHGKGADMGAAFGGGSSGSLFGASGSANALSRATKILVMIFFLTSIGLTYFSFGKTSAGLSVKQAPAPAQQAPAAPAPGPVAPNTKDIPN